MLTNLEKTLMYALMKKGFDMNMRACLMTDLTESQQEASLNWMIENPKATKEEISQNLTRIRMTIE